LTKGFGTAKGTDAECCLNKIGIVAEKNLFVVPISFFPSYLISLTVAILLQCILLFQWWLRNKILHQV